MFGNSAIHDKKNEFLVEALASAAYNVNKSAKVYIMKPVLNISIPLVMTRLFILSEYDEERFRTYLFYVCANG